MKIKSEWFDELLGKRKDFDGKLKALRDFEASPEGVLYGLIKLNIKNPSKSDLDLLKDTRGGEILVESFEKGEAMFDALPHSFFSFYSDQNFRTEAADAIIKLMVEKEELENKLAIALAARPAPKDSSGRGRL